MLTKRVWRFISILFLILTASVANAGIDEGDILGIDEGGILGIDEGGILGIDEGGILGIDEGGIDRIVLSGTINTDPLSLNGIQLDLRSAAINRDGRAFSAASILEGQIAVVTGTLRKQVLVVQNLSLNSTLTGPIEKIDAVNQTVTILGQSVQFDAATQMGIPGNALAAGTWITVDGLVSDKDKAILATRIDAATHEMAELTGVLENADTARLTLRIGNQLIDYSSAGIVDLNSGLPQVGQSVRIRGNVGHSQKLFRADFVQESH